MAQEEGVVTSIKGDGWAQVVTERKGACGDCKASTHCCASFGSSSKMVVKALNRAGAGEGDLISLDISSRVALKGAAAFYLIPIAGLLAGAVTGSGLSQRLGMSETGGAIWFGLAGLALGFLVTNLITRRMVASNQLTPVITRIIKHRAQAPEGLITVDPVCKMVVNPDEAAASFIYQEKNYYFCHPACREAFEKDPESYL